MEKNYQIFSKFFAPISYNMTGHHVHRQESDRRTDGRTGRVKLIYLTNFVLGDIITLICLIWLFYLSARFPQLHGPLWTINIITGNWPFVAACRILGIHMYRYTCTCRCMQEPINRWSVMSFIKIKWQWDYLALCSCAIFSHNFESQLNAAWCTLMFKRFKVII